MRVRAMQNDTVDAICWRVFGRTQGVVEATLAANPGLADLGPILPHGHPIDLPDQPAQAEKKTVQLWD
ncbi:phage tail protein [Pandoraea anapnoica]|uniref:Phage tail protein n=2 Tax=Pandoraea TaxID=93217 RepID=A0A5E5A2S6_9BURK|nr:MULTISPECIES: tail protein X [Pandoraea]VVE67904.1 phage tail protein [Pandoraea captiosa]VVE71622.1 phage tail protein [Pandoraea anapnoica]